MMIEKYIKMCMEAKKLQEGWVPKIGNRFVPLNPRTWSGVDYVNTDFIIWQREKVFRQEDFIFLPTQEQLQEMYKQHRKSIGECDCGECILQQMNCFTQAYFGDTHRMDIDINMLWLLLVMATTSDTETMFKLCSTL